MGRKKDAEDGTQCDVGSEEKSGGAKREKTKKESCWTTWGARYRMGKNEESWR